MTFVISVLKTLIKKIKSNIIQIEENIFNNNSNKDCNNGSVNFVQKITNSQRLMFSLKPQIFLFLKLDKFLFNKDYYLLTFLCYIIRNLIITSKLQQILLVI